MSVDPTPRRSRSVALIVLGSVIGLLGIALLAGGGGVLWADQTQRNSAGYFTGSEHDVSSSSYAITHNDIRVHHLPGFLDDGKLARISIDARSAGGTAPFIGIARKPDVDAYLNNVAHANLRDYDVGTDDQQYDFVGGTARPAAPASEPIWVASSTGTQPLTWRLREGDWSVVLMNADGSKGVAATVELGADIGYLGEVTAGLFTAGALLVALALFLTLRGARRNDDEQGSLRTEAEPGQRVAAVRSVAGAYPVVLGARLDEPLSRGLWLIKWLLAIPHFILLAFLWFAFLVLTVVAWFAVVTTGRYPRRIFDFNLGVLRWTWRVSYYGYGALGTDRYPPFSLDREPDYPATLDIMYPGQQSRLTAFARLLLAFPHLLIAGVFVGGGAYWIDHASGWHVTSPWSGLVGLLVLVAAVALMFTGRYPRGLFDLVVGLNRWVLRVIAYTTLMTDEYPPFRLDSGGDEPQVTPRTTVSPQF